MRIYLCLAIFFVVHSVSSGWNFDGSHDQEGCLIILLLCLFLPLNLLLYLLSATLFRLSFTFLNKLGTYSTFSRIDSLIQQKGQMGMLLVRRGVSSD